MSATSDGELTPPHLQPTLRLLPTLQFSLITVCVPEPRPALGHSARLCHSLPRWLWCCWGWSWLESRNNLSLQMFGLKSLLSYFTSLNSPASRCLWVGDPLAQLPAGRDKHSNASSVSPSAACPERDCHGWVACRQCCPQAAHGLLRRQDRMWAALVPAGESPAWAVLLGPRPGGGCGAEC